MAQPFSQLFSDPLAALGYGLLTSGQNPVGAAMGVMQQAEASKAAQEQVEFQKLMMQYKMQQAQQPKLTVANDAEGRPVVVDKIAGTYKLAEQMGMPSMPIQQAAPIAGGIQSRELPPMGNIDQYAVDSGVAPPAPNASLDDIVSQARAMEAGQMPMPAPNMQGMPPQLPSYIPDTQPQMTPRPIVQPGTRSESKLKEAEINAYGEKLKPLPANIAKRQDEILEEIDIASSLSADLDALRQTVQSGGVDLGFGKNLVYEVQNRLGKSDTESLAYNDIKRVISRIRNDTLRLNKGTQTEGDAKRALDELLSNINDPQIVNKVLGDISTMNNRAAQFKQNRLNRMLGEYGKPPIDFSSYQVQPAISQPQTVSGGLTPEEEQELMQLRQKYGRGQ